MHEQAANLFTAGQIAKALGRNRQAVQWLLRSVKPCGQLVIKGNDADAWTIPSLPEKLRSELTAEAREQQIELEELLECGRIWQPATPFARWPEESQSKARKLKSALGRALRMIGNAVFSVEDRERIGLEDYQREFGASISARHLREMIQRTLDRDAGANDWERIEIYLPDRLPAKSELMQAETGPDFDELSSFISLCSNPPTEIERRGIWTCALLQYSRIISSGHSPKQAARRMRKYLFAKAPFLAASKDALLKAFERKLERWQLSKFDPKALADGRANNGSAFELTEEDRDMLIHRAVFKYRGDIAPAWRELLEKGFSQKVRARYMEKAESKSHVPESIRDDVTAEVEVFTVMHQGPRAFDQIKGHVNRNYDGIASLECITADDFTMPIYFYVEDSKGWFTLTRGQILIFSDFRTLRILGWSIQPDRNYSSLTIRSLCTHVFAEHGVPKVLQFERGIWESSTLIKGRDPAIGMQEVVQGLREFGIRFIHSIRARSKTIERIGGLLQDLMEGDPGYCGRQERKDAPESLRKQMAAVAGRKPGCLDHFYSYDQWNKRFGEIVEQYNATRQQGKILAGLSPDQAFAQFANHEDPPMQFNAAVRYLPAHDKRPAPVTLNGVTMQIGKKHFNYRGKEIAHLVGDQVLAWFDPENPETIVLTNMERENPICVARSNEPSALECLIDPASQTLGRELQRIEDQASYMKARYHAVKSKFPMPSRITLATTRTVELGKEIEEQKAKQTTAQKQQARARTAYSKLNMAVPADAFRRPETLEAAERLQQLLNEEE